jgi:hypothetical protein
MPVANEPQQCALAVLDGHPAQIFAIKLDQIKRAQRHNLVAPLVVQQIKHRQPVFVAGNRLAVDHARTDWQGGNRRGDQRKAGGEVIPRPRHELHTVAAAMRDDPKAVVLDFVNPAWACRRLLCWPRKAGVISGKGLLDANAAPQLTRY